MAMNMGMGTNPLAAMGGGMGITGLPVGMAAGSTAGSGLAGIFSEAQAMMGLLGAVQYAPGALGGISSELGMTAFGLQQILADIPQIMAMGNPAAGMMGQTGMAGLGMSGMGMPGMGMSGLGMSGMAMPGMTGMPATGMPGMGMM